VPTLATMVKAALAIRGGVTWPSVYTHRTWLPSVLQAQYAENAPLPRHLIATGRLPGNALGWLHPGWVDERTSASSTMPRMAQADRVAEFKEVAVFLRRLKRRGERRVQRTLSTSTSAGCGGCRE
jgi:hypothetical protein